MTPARLPLPRRRSLTAGAVGVATDCLSRFAIFPHESPVGLFAALIGGPRVVRLLASKEIPQ